MYGVVWRGKHKENGVDQLKFLAEELKTNPYSSRLCVTSWIPELLPKDLKDPKANAKMWLGVLAPCHCFYQVVPIKKENEWTLNLQIYIRSSDVPVGLPFNIAQYALLTHLLANHCQMKVGKLSVVLGDAHIYADQLEDCKIQLQRTPKTLPEFKLADYAIGKSIFDIVSTDFVLTGVSQDEHIPYKVSI
jgi:thymidylate synthase